MLHLTIPPPLETAPIFQDFIKKDVKNTGVDQLGDDDYNNEIVGVEYDNNAKITGVDAN